MSGAVAALMAASRGYFAPTTRTYDAGTGATETVPNGASQVTIAAWAGGGGGAGGSDGWVGGGGASGSYSARTIALLPADWGKTFTYSVGAAGTPSNTGGTTSVSNGTFGTAVAMSCLGGGGGTPGIASDGAGGVGQAASGGTTNTPGVNGTDGGEGAGAPNGGGSSFGVGTAPGGGGSGSNPSGNAGAAGRVRFSYT